MFHSDKRVLITGGAGFIGYNLALSMLKDGWEVAVLDNYNDYYDVNLKYARSARLAELGCFMINSDILNTADLDSNFDLFKPRLVVHLAAMVGVRHSMTHANAYHNVNVIGTQNIIDACEKHMVGRIIYASTSCVAAGQSIPWKEDEPIRHQLNPYGYTKYVNECQFKMQQIPNQGLRFFTVYGPWGRPDMALFTWTKCLLENKPLPMFNNGNMIRDWTYIDDIVNGLKTIIARNDLPSGEVYNIGNGNPVNILDFALTLSSVIGVGVPEIEALPRHPADTLETFADTTKIQSLGWSPTTSVNDGIPKFWEWYKQYYNVE